MLLLLTMLAACERDLASAPPVRRAEGAPRFDETPTHGAADSLRALAATRGIVALSPTPVVRKELVQLGRALAFDPILSGNRNMACMTCHLPAFATGDGKNLSIGEGGIGLGTNRTLGRGVFIPRNAPPLFNLFGLNQLFWDGRVSVDAAGVFHTPASAQVTPAMAQVFEFGAISAIGLFPVTSRTEMRGQNNLAITTGGFTRNELAQIPDSDFTGIWKALMARLGAIAEYRQLFEAAYPGTPFSSMTFAHASNAMAGFFVDQLTFNNTSWDHFLAGDDAALTPQQFSGANVFMSTTAKCAVCHNGPLFTDAKTRNVALAQFGPGEGNGPSGNDDFGRINVTGVATDKYAFKTPALRNVELTGPYGHAGQFATLRGFVDHYSESDIKLANYDVSQIDPLLRGTLLATTADILATRAGGLNGLVLTAQQIDDLTAYLLALTDPRARSLGTLTPVHVPSGLTPPGAPVLGIPPIKPLASASSANPR
ncbi:MAG TPA: cytochrome c peroxidase [Gemmatimonadaceae bacterium]|nr:cytochrome c peroxidase [Gemmatimonadaceae bacterium]